MNIGRKIRERRIELGMTQADVAKMVGVAASAVSQWESGGIANMRRDRISKLAAVLEMNPVELIDMDGQATQEVDDIAQALHQNPKLRILFDKSRKMSDADMDAVLSIVNAITKERDG